MVNRLRLALVVALFFGLILVVGKVAQTASAQGGTEQPADNASANALKRATLFLSQKIGKPISKLDNFTYEQATFPDAGLGCPEQGKNYAPGPVPGYKFLITLDGILYELHTSLDGSKVALCSGTGIKQQVGLATYRSPLFTIPYPDQWTSVDRDKDIFFGLGPSPVCAQPGMTVTALGNVAADKTADAMLDDYARTTPGTQLGPDRISIGSTGRSVTYVTTCTDGSSRMMRVTAFVAYGHSYRILQFAPQNAFDQWADTYLKILQRFAPGSTPVGGNIGLAIQQPDKSPLALLAHVFAGNIYTGILAGLPGTPITMDAVGNHAYRDIAVSPGGDQLVYIDPSVATLYAAPTAGGTPRKLADKLAAGYPAAWSPDGHEVAYLVDDGAKDGDRSIYSVMAVRADDQTTRKIGDTQSLKADCTDKTTDPAELVYWSETGPGGNPLLLSWTPEGTIYYSLGCDGTGVGQIAGDGTNSAVVHPALRRVHVSPDGSELLGMTGQPPSIVRFKPSDHSAVTITTSAPPDQLAWSAAANAVYYSTLAAKNTITLNDAAQQARGTQVFGTWPFQSTVYQVSLHKIDLASNQDVVLGEVTGRAVGHIAPSPDGSGVLYTLVESDANLAEAFQNNATAGDLLRQAPGALLYWITLPNGQPQLLAYTGDPTWGGIGSAPAPTPTSGPKQTPGAIKPAASPTMTPTVPPSRATAKPTTRATISAMPPATNTRQPESSSTSAG